MNNFDRETWMEKNQQRSAESMIQFIRQINPIDAATFINGVHQANELAHSLNTDTLVIAQRGGGSFDCAMKELDRLLDREPLKTIYLPIGTQTDITKKNAMRNPGIDEKTAIAEEVITNENIGKNITFVEEAKSGNSVVVFLEYILPLIRKKTENLESVNIIMMIDKGSPIDQDRKFIEQLREKYGVSIHEIVTSLSISDKKSFIDELIYDPSSQEKKPEFVSNEIIRSFIKLLSIGALYPNQLLDLLNDYFPPTSDLNKMRNTATSKLSEPSFVNSWLLQYCGEIQGTDESMKQL